MAAPTTRQRLIEACFHCVARWGLAKTTVEDVAREAGVSRATLYRHFSGGKDELLAAVVSWEASGFFERLTRAASSRPDLAGLLEEAIVVAHRELRDHAVLQRILETEPERLLPLLTVENTRVIVMIRQFLVLALARTPLRPDVDVDRAADYLAHMLLSVVGSPGRWDLTDRRQVADLVEHELLGGLV